MKLGNVSISGKAATGVTLSVAGVITMLLTFIHAAQAYCPNLPPAWVGGLGTAATVLGIAMTFFAHPPTSS